MKNTSRFYGESQQFANKAFAQHVGLSRAASHGRLRHYGLGGSIATANPEGGSRYTKTIRTIPSFFEQSAFNSLGTTYATLLTGHSMDSPSQIMSDWVTRLRLGERIL